MLVFRIKNGLRWRARLAAKAVLDGIELMKFCALYPIALFYRNRGVWIIADRGTDAGDNGFHLFRYLRAQDPSRPVYFIISKASADLKKAAPCGNIIYHRSLKHYLYFIAADVRISSHFMGCSPRRDFYARNRRFLPLPGKTVFLQHGVIQCDLKALYADKTKLDLFICGAGPEYDYVRTQFGYRHGEVRYTGLARYDQLHAFKTKKQILIMPTWRMSVVNYGYGGGAVAETEYMKRWNALLNHTRLLAAADRAGVTLLFYPHYELQKYRDQFVSACSRVIIADPAQYDVQTLLKESALLVTDYSSVHFDFGYMKKPCLYYQFDPEDFFGRHYGRGYFDFQTMGFGEVTENEEELVDLILEAIEHGFPEKETYRQRCAAFFPLHDQNNCRRIYDEILQLAP